MRINSISFHNHNTGWNYSDLPIDYLTLLVGASGVGKTQILRSLIDIARIAKGASFNGIEWTVKFTIDNSLYVWEGEFESVAENDVN